MSLSLASGVHLGLETEVLFSLKCRNGESALKSDEELAAKWALFKVGPKMSTRLLP